MNSNQLKLNLDTVVDGLNLVNVVRRPQPIVFANVTGTGIRNHSPPTRDSGLKDYRQSTDFEVIDENKMTMYSYLVRREMKTKEWLSRFHLSRPGEERDENKEKCAKKPTAGEKKKTAVVSRTGTKNRSPGGRINRITGFASKTSNDFVELKTCCDETVRSIEYLEQKLRECKNSLILAIYIFFF